MRPPATFEVEVDGIGTFRFRRRTMRDQLAINAKTQEALAGLTGDEAEMVAEALATIPLLTLAAPAGWNVDELDPLDTESWRQLGQVYGGLRAAEARFRAGPAAERQGMGPGRGGDGGIPMAAPLRPAAD